MLKGADPLYQMDLRADPPCIKRCRPGALHSFLVLPFPHGCEQEAEVARSLLCVYANPLTLLRIQGVCLNNGKSEAHNFMWLECSKDKCRAVLSKACTDILSCACRDLESEAAWPAGMGEVHDGLWAGLHQPDPARPGSLVLDRLASLLASAGRGKRIFLCGHSMGGAVAALLALLLPLRCATRSRLHRSLLRASFDLAFECLRCSLLCETRHAASMDLLQAAACSSK